MMNISTQPVLTKLFENYSETRHWSQRFQTSPDDAEAYEIEFRGLALSGRRFLEVGFGPGSLLAWARSKGANVAGIEVDPVSIAAAKAEGVCVLPAEIETIAAQYAGQFDVAAAFDVLEHLTLDNIMAHLRALEIMLKPGGYLILRFPNAQSPFGLAPLHGDATHQTPLSGDKFAQLIRGMEYSILHYGRAARPRGRNPLKWVVRSARYLGQDFLEGSISMLYPPPVPLSAVVSLRLRRSC